jgi:hypothetical protein
MVHKPNTPKRIAYWRVIRQIESVVRNNDSAISIITKHDLESIRIAQYYINQNEAWEEALSILRHVVHKV